MSDGPVDRPRRVRPAASPTRSADPKAPVTRKGPSRHGGRPDRGQSQPALSGSDEASRHTIRTALATNLLVEAGAGSGKTQMLAERMAAGIASGVYQVEHLAAVTFTRKAASELRGRFHLALERQLAAAMPDSEVRVRAALGNLERFFAGTIHSFCARLLRERPVESGVSPGFTELDEVQDEDLRNRAWRDFITSARSAGDAEVLELLDTGVQPKHLESAFATICLNDDVEFPPGEGACPEPKTAWKALERFWAELERHLPGSLDEDTTCEIQQAARQFRAQMRVARKKLDRPSTIADLLATWDCKSSIIQNRWADSAAERKRFKALIEPLHAAFCAETVAPYRRAWRQYVYRLSVSLLTRAREHAARERHRRNALNYGDLLNLTAKVLRENSHVRQALQQKYRHLFVDEFQDTDPIQAEIVFLLGEAAPAPAPAASGSTRAAGNLAPRADWRTIPIRSGALFVVGDPKQSIYRFRRADIEIYNTVRARFSEPAVGTVVSLTRNFRSVPPLCEWANTVFAERFPSEPTVYSPRFARLDPNEDAGTPKAKHPAGLFTISHGGASKNVPAADAGAIARYIRAEVDAGRRSFSDFLILTRKKKGRIAPYASALEALNIPMEVSGAGAFGESAEVAALTVLLRALADPQDQLTLVNVLRGPLFGLSDPELFEYKQAGGWFSIFGDSAESAPRTNPVAAALATLRQYYRWTRMLPAGAALDKVLEHTGYLALASTSPGGVEAGDLVHAVDRVRQVLEQGGNLADAAEALGTDSEASNEVESLPLEPGRSDVVRLMNLHKAKGLEAAVVFLADPCGGPKRRVDVHIARDGATAIGWCKIVQKYERGGERLLAEHADWETHHDAEEPYLEAEEDRLLYVAATRARELLVVSRHSGSGYSVSAWGVLNEALEDATELPVPQTVLLANPEPAACSAESQAEASAARAERDAVVTRRSWSITSVTAESKHIAKMAAAPEPSIGDDATRVVAENTPSHRADAGMAWGTLIHGLLEHAMRHKSATREDLRRLAVWLTVEEPRLRGVIEDALDTVEQVAAADFWAHAATTEHSVETPFTVAGRPDQLVSGTIDLLFARETGWEVIDYKTDTAMDERSAAYENQMRAYAQALGVIGLEPVVTSLRRVRSSRS
jgi:ATP-dependent helicase/nuclease subunit A